MHAGGAGEGAARLRSGLKARQAEAKKAVALLLSHYLERKEAVMSLVCVCVCVCGGGRGCSRAHRVCVYVCVLGGRPWGRTGVGPRGVQPSHAGFSATAPLLGCLSLAQERVAHTGVQSQRCMATVPVVATVAVAAVVQ